MQSFIFKAIVGAQAATAIKIGTKAKCPFGHTSNTTENLAQDIEEVQYLEQMFADSLEFSQNMTPADYEAIAQSIFTIHNELPTEVTA